MTASHSAATGLAAWHDIVANPDPAKLPDLLADDVVFWSPVVHSPQAGRDLTTMYLLGAMQVLLPGGFTYVREVVDGDDAVLEFTADVNGRTVNGVDMLHFNADGKIDNFTVMLRPLSGTIAVKDKMAELLAQQQRPRR